MEKEDSIDSNQLRPITKEEVDRVYDTFRRDAIDSVLYSIKLFQDFRKSMYDPNPTMSAMDFVVKSRPCFNPYLNQVRFRGNHPLKTLPPIHFSPRSEPIKSTCTEDESFIAELQDKCFKALMIPPELIYTDAYRSMFDTFNTIRKNADIPTIVIDSLGTLEDAVFNNKEDNEMTSEEKLIKRWEINNIEKIDEQRDVILEELRCEDWIHRAIHEHIEVIRDIVRKKGYGECIDYHLDSIDKYDFSENTTDGLYVVLEENRDELIDETIKWANETAIIVNVMDTSSSKIQALIVRGIINDTYEIVTKTVEELNKALDPRNS